MSDITLIEDLAQQNITEVPTKILNLSNLKMLYLESNDIKEIPYKLFINLKQLIWLDLRNNKLKTIPSSIIYHGNLETLLLQNNEITRLPQELGFVPKLTVLQLSGNPILYPSKSIIEQGVTAIKSFLQSEYSAEKLNSSSASNNSTTTESTYSETTSNTEKDTDKIKFIFQEKSSVSRSDDIPIITLKSYHRFMHRPTRKKEKSKKNKKGCKSKVSVNKTSDDTNKILNTIPKKKNDIRVQEQFMKDLWLKNLKELMTKQQDTMQKEQDQEVLQKWRKSQTHKNFKLDMKYRPEVPYDLDPDYDYIPTRHELLLKRIEKAQKRIHLPGKPKKINIDNMISDIIKSLKEMEREKPVAKSPIDGMKEAGRDIKQILALQKRISALKIQNDKM